MSIYTNTISIGVDLGTSSSCAAYIDPKTKSLQVLSHNGKATIPSWVFYDPIAPNTVAIGEEARVKQSSYPKNTIFGSKRLIGKEVNDRRILKDLSYGVFDLDKTANNEVAYKITASNGEITLKTPQDVASELLRGLKQKLERETGYTVDSAVITIPANFTSDQRQATLSAANSIGLRVLRLFAEPSAAALYYSDTKAQQLVNSSGNVPEYIMVYDFGGGTLDVSLVRCVDHPTNGQHFEILGTSGDPLLGGQNLDQDLMKHCTKQITKNFKLENEAVLMDDDNFRRRLRAKCIEAKELLSTNQSVDMDFDDMYMNKPFTYKLSRTTFNIVCKETLQRALRPIKEVLAQAGVDKSDVKDVVLVGGSSRVPLIRDQLIKFFGLNDISQLSRTINPDEAVARGAAVLSAMLSNHKAQQISRSFSIDSHSIPLTLVAKYKAENANGTVDELCEVIPLVDSKDKLPLMNATKTISIPRNIVEKVDNLDISIYQMDVSLNDQKDVLPHKFDEKHFKRLFKHWSLPIQAPAMAFGDNSPYLIDVHYKLDENAILDLYFHDRAMNYVIDVNANKNTTKTEVQKTIKEQKRIDVLESYKAATQGRLTIPAAPSRPLRPAHLPPVNVQDDNQTKGTPDLTPPVIQPKCLEITPSEPPLSPNQEPQRPMAPPQVPSSVYRDIIKVRDDMITELQNQIISMKSAMLQQNNDYNNLQSQFTDQGVLINKLQRELADVTNNTYLIKDQAEHAAQLANIHAEADQKYSTVFTQFVKEQDRALQLERDNQLLQIDLHKKVELIDWYMLFEKDTNEKLAHIEALEAENTELNSYIDEVTVLFEQKSAQLNETQDLLDKVQNELKDRDIVVSDLIEQVAAKDQQLDHVKQQSGDLQAQIEIIKLQQEKEKKQREEVRQQHLALEQATKASIPVIIPAASPPTIKLPPTPPLIKRQSTVRNHDIDEQRQVFAALPPPPPIMPEVFAEPIFNRSRAPVMPVESPPVIEKQAEAALTPSETPLITSETSSASGPSPASLPALFPPRGFLQEILQQKTLKHVEIDQTAKEPDTSAPSCNPLLAGIASGRSILKPVEQEEPPVSAQPRVVLLSQLQLGQKNLKAVEHTPESAPVETKTTVAGFDQDFVDKIANYRKHIADDDFEDDADDDW